MPEIDPVVFEYIAKVDKYVSDVRRTTRTVDQQLGLQERRVKSLEQQYRTSSGQISGSLRGLAGAFAAAFSARQVQQMADSYTRFTNQLTVAGLEGQALVDVQERLFEIAQRNGVQLEAVGTLYSRAAQSSAELGASQEQLVQFTDAVAASLRISGTSATEAQGSLLQLGQALGSPRVQAEEFNSLLDTMQPLLREAAKEIDGTGGTIGGLTRLIKDQNGAGLSNVQLFNAIIAAQERLSATADETSLTIGNAFTTLNNALGRYIGETDDALSATERIAGGINTLAENLDILIPALVIVSTALGVGYVTNAIAARVATVSLGTAATATGRAMLAAFGGPVGLAITAVALGLAYLATTSETAEQRIDRLAQSADEAAQEADRMEARLREAGVAMYQVEAASDGAAGGFLRAGAAARSAQGDLYNLEQQAIRTATALIDAQLIENQRRSVALGREQRRADSVARSPELAQRDSGVAISRGQDARNAEREQLDREYRALNRQRNAIIAGVRAGVDVTSDAPTSTPVTPTSTASSGGRSRDTGPDETEIERRYRDELDSIRSRLNSAEAQRAQTAEERAEFEMRQLEIAEDVALRSLEADEDYTEAQRAIVRERLLALGEAERDAVEFERRRQLEQEAQELADERYAAEYDALRLQYDLATTERERRDISLRILDAEDDYLRAKLEAVRDSGTAAAIDRERARINLASLNATAGARRDAELRRSQGPLGRYADAAADYEARIEEAAAERIRSLNGTIVDVMTRELGVDDPFLRDLISIFLDRNVFGPLAQGIAGKGGGIGGILNSVLSLFGGGGSPIPFGGGKASGGPVNAGKAYMVGESGRELFIPRVPGNIVTNQNLGKAIGGGVATVRLQLSDDIDARIVDVSGPVAVEINRAMQPQTINAAVNETMRQAGRRRI